MLANPTARNIILSLGNQEPNPLTYQQLGDIIREQNKTKASITAHYVRELCEGKIIKKDHDHYFLTRIGLQCVKVLKAFIEITKTYDLDDVDQDGRLEIVRYTPNKFTIVEIN